MGNSRKYIPRTSSSVEIDLRSRLYPAEPLSTSTRLHPRQINVATRQPNSRAVNQRYPFPENHIGGSSTQPWVHNCLVTVREGRNTYQYMVFFKRHCLLKSNQTLSALVGKPSRLCSDAVVMRIGVKAAYVNMRDRDTILADWLMKKFCRKNIFTRSCLPTQLTFTKSH
ncbi:hypothetical protein BDN70DRAFT_648252 [Pholiota conissans]|uniref:Uncharacterized protein n=1 Tax=Pholiota conissans TaxID=109636 RepID=A0A9P5YKW2_9AGAR|nr:hypothetical protein BDN70DRAFT_648252 [Pholiota conissans]